jgi:hypothetical protein
VLYVIFAGTVNMVHLPDKHEIPAMSILTLCVIILSGLACRYIKTQLKLKDIAGAQSATASIILSELISEDKNGDELEKYLEIKNGDELKNDEKLKKYFGVKANGDLNFQSAYAFPTEFVKKSIKLDDKGHGFQDTTRSMIYGILILVTILSLTVKWLNVFWRL